MVDFLSSWVSGVTVSVIIATILEMILPDGKNKKYIKTVIGMYVLFSIISPIVTKVTGSTIEVQNIFSKDDAWLKTYEVAAMDTESSVKSVYINGLKEDIINKLTKKGYQVSTLKLELENKDYGKINSIYLTMKKVSEKELDEKQNNNIQTEIKRINIKIEDVSNEKLDKIQKTSEIQNLSKEQNEGKREETKKESEAEKILNTEIKTVKEYLSSTYGVPVKDININE